jgi:hypothetical protein
MKRFDTQFEGEISAPTQSEYICSSEIAAETVSVLENDF